MSDKYKELREISAKHVGFVTVYAPNIQNLLSERDALLEELEHISEYWNRSNDEESMADALWHIIETADVAIEADNRQEDA